MFGRPIALAAAYGIAVSGTMLITTILLYRVAVSRWQWPPVVAIPVIAFFGAIEAHLPGFQFDQDRRRAAGFR
jgi:K+ transporter